MRVFVGFLFFCHWCFSDKCLLFYSCPFSSPSVSCAFPPPCIMPIFFDSYIVSFFYTFGFANLYGLVCRGLECCGCGLLSVWSLASIVLYYIWRLARVRLFSLLNLFSAVLLSVLPRCSLLPGFVRLPVFHLTGGPVARVSSILPYSGLVTALSFGVCSGVVAAGLGRVLQLFFFFSLASGPLAGDCTCVRSGDTLCVSGFAAITSASDDYFFHVLCEEVLEGRFDGMRVRCHRGCYLRVCLLLSLLGLS